MSSTAETYRRSDCGTLPSSTRTVGRCLDVTAWAHARGLLKWIRPPLSAVSLERITMLFASPLLDRPGQRTAGGQVRRATASCYGRCAARGARCAIEQRLGAGDAGMASLKPRRSSRVRSASEHDGPAARSRGIKRGRERAGPSSAARRDGTARVPPDCVTMGEIVARGNVVSRVHNDPGAPLRRFATAVSHPRRARRALDGYVGVRGRIRTVISAETFVGGARG